MTDAQRFAATASAYDRPDGTFNSTLTLVGRGTQMGELLRRYWHPVCKSDKLKDLPVKARALGEDIILFRKPSGEVGAVYPRCIHRGTDLIWGKITDLGLRCCYHGWTFDTDGRCMSQPCEPENGGKARNVVRQPWYPAQERYGFVFVYLGPLDRKPPLPRYDVLENIPEGFEIYADDSSIPSAGAGYMPCNWLQHHENGLDPAHVPIVHEHQFPPILAKAETAFDFEKRPDRVRSRGLFKLGPEMLEMRVELVLPTIRIIPDPRLATARPDGKCDNIAWTLPKDDTDTITFTAVVKPIGFGLDNNGELYNGKRWTDLDFEGHQRFPGDFEAQVGQGPISLHSEEHLVSSDRGVVFFRRMLEAALKDVAEGRDPPLSFGGEELLIESWSGVNMLPNPDFVGEVAPVATAGEPIASVLLEGQWRLSMETPMGVQTVFLDLTDGSSGWWGVVSGDEGALPAMEMSVEGNRLRWTTAVTKPLPLTLQFDVTVAGDSLTGTFKPGVFPAGPVHGERVVESAAAG